MADLLRQGDAVAALEDSQGRSLLQRMAPIGLEAFHRWSAAWEPQAANGYCGPASALAALRFLEMEASWTQSKIMEEVIIPNSLFTQGLSLSNGATMLRILGAGRFQTIKTSSFDEAEVAEQLKCDLSAAFQQGDRICLLVNYPRLGSGHWSPIGGWSNDHILILDTNSQKLPPYWVHINALTQSMCRLNRATGQPRGYLLLRPTSPKENLLM